NPPRRRADLPRRPHGGAGYRSADNRNTGLRNTGLRDTGLRNTGLRNTGDRGARMRTWLAFHRRDTRERRSRLLAGLAEGSGILLTVVTFYFLGELVDRGTSGEVARLNGSYFAFAVNGIAMAGFLAQTVRGHSRALRAAQLEGTLEPMLMTPVPPWRIAVGGALHEMQRGLLHRVVYGGVARALGVVAVDGQLAWLPVVLAVAALSILPFGVLAASYTLLLARGEPVTYLTNAGTLLLAGVYFPSSVLPAWLQPVSL